MDNPVSYPTMMFQMLLFVVFAVATMKYVWQPLMRVMDERRARMAGGAAASEKAVALAKETAMESEEVLRVARISAQEILAAANKEAGEVIEQARKVAEAERDRIKAEGAAHAREDIAIARETLRNGVGGLAVSAASRVLNRPVDAGAHADVIDELASRL